MRYSLMAIIALFSLDVVALPVCTFEHWDTYQNTTLIREKTRNAYLFSRSEVKVDADGAPNAYHPDDVNLHCTKGTGFKGLDCPANGGYPTQSWWRSAIVPDPSNNNQAYVQREENFKGFFISKSSLQDNTKKDTDITKYVDATTVPYLVFPGKFYAKAGTGALGDIGYAINLDNQKASSFIVAEVGPPNASLGEMSIALATALGGNNPNPRTGAGTPQGNILYVIFPRSKNTPAWPRTKEDLEQSALALIESVGGLDAVKNCVTH